MSTARRTWQLVESRVAAFFGCRRKVLSGSSGRDDSDTCSDSTHGSLFIEAKLRQKSAARTLWRETAALAKKENKTPVVAIADKNCPGFLVVVHSDHMEEVVDAWLEARGEIRRRF